MLDLERRAIAAFENLGVAMTNTCINYQTIQAPTRSEHVAFGDTGVVIYSNSVCGARSNFEGGPSALAAGLTGRTPRYGFHLPELRRGTLRIQVDFTPTTLNGWGALGGVIGRLAGNYWAVPVIEGIEGAPKSDQLKHFGASMASFGSIALFHLVGLTPEAGRLADVADAGLPGHRITQADVDALQRSYHTDDRGRCGRVLGAATEPVRVARSGGLCDGRRFTVPLLAVTSPQVKPDSDRMGYTARIEAAGGNVFSGMCFYQSYAREISEANGWKRLATNSAKLVNILGGYGYRPMLASMEVAWMRPSTASWRRHERQVFQGTARDGPHRTRACAGGPRWIFRPLRSRPHQGVFSRPRTSWPASPMSAGSWSSTPPRAAWRRPGCCTRCNRVASYRWRSS